MAGWDTSVNRYLEENEGRPCEKGFAIRKARREEKPGKIFEKVRLQSSKVCYITSGGDHCLNGNIRDVLLKVSLGV